MKEDCDNADNNANKDQNKPNKTELLSAYKPAKIPNILDLKIF